MYLPLGSQAGHAGLQAGHAGLQAERLGTQAGDVGVAGVPFPAAHRHGHLLLEACGVEGAEGVEEAGGLKGAEGVERAEGVLGAEGVEGVEGVERGMGGGAAQGSQSGVSARDRTRLHVPHAAACERRCAVAVYVPCFLK